MTNRQFIKLFRDARETLKKSNASKVPSIKHDRLIRRYIIFEKL